MPNRVDGARNSDGFLARIFHTPMEMPTDRRVRCEISELDDPFVDPDRRAIAVGIVRLVGPPLSGPLRAGQAESMFEFLSGRDCAET
jgi:hypothetical protein